MSSEGAGLLAPEPVGTLDRVLPRCAHCQEEVLPAQRSPCPACGAMQHGRCYVRAGGCPTAGCANGPEKGTLAARGPEQLAAAALDAAQRQVRVHLGVSAGAGLVGGSGGVGMVLSALAMTFADGVVVGAFSFVAGALLLITGQLVLTLAALRPPQAVPQGRGALHVVAASLSALLLVSGVAGMGMSWLVMLLGATLEMIVGGGGFAAGAVLVLGGAVSAALLALAPAPAGTGSGR